MKVWMDGWMDGGRNEQIEEEKAGHMYGFMDG